MREYIEAVREQRQAVRYLGTLFVYQFGLNAILPYLVLFIVEDIHQTDQVAFGLSAALLVITAVGAVVFGRLADHIGTRQVMAIGWSLLALSAIGGVLVTNLVETMVVVLIAGVGNGAATAVSWPLLTALIPPKKTGVFAGLKAAAESIAIPLSVVVAAEVFLPHFGYRGIFAMLAITIVVALVLLLRFVHVPAAYTSDQPAGVAKLDRRGGLKIRGKVTTVRVRIPPSAPILNSKDCIRAMREARLSDDGYTYGYTYRARVHLSELARGRQFAFDEASMAGIRRMRPTVIESSRRWRSGARSSV